MQLRTTVCVTLVTSRRIQYEEIQPIFVPCHFSVRGNTTYLLLVTRVMRSFSTNPVAVGRGQKGATGAWVLAVALSRLSRTAVL